MQQPIQATMLVLTLAAAPAIAQSPAVNTHWSWTEVYAGTTSPVANPNGILEPGESAMLHLTVSFDPPVGTNLPAPGAPGATVAGLVGAAIHLEGHLSSHPFALASGEFSHLWGRTEWFPFNIGTPIIGLARVLAIDMGQVLVPGQVANPENPIADVWSAVWTPDSYSTDTLRFASSWALSSGGHILLQTGTDPQTGAPIYGATHRVYTLPHGQVQIPMIPAPGAAPLFVLSSLALFRRRRAKQPSRTN